MSMFKLALALIYAYTLNFTFFLHFVIDKNTPGPAKALVATV